MNPVAPYTGSWPFSVIPRRKSPHPFPDYPNFSAYAEKTRFVQKILDRQKEFCQDKDSILHTFLAMYEAAKLSPVVTLGFQCPGKPRESVRVVASTLADNIREDERGVFGIDLEVSADPRDMNRILESVRYSPDYARCWISSRDILQIRKNNVILWSKPSPNTLA